MREIKFRAWDKRGLRMHKVFNIDFIQKLICFDTLALGEDTPTWDKLEHFELMQYIGRKDKNKKDMCAGDIVKSGDKIGIIKWNSSYPQFYVYGIDGRNIDYDFYEDWEVIGNEYENADLLKAA